jgi:lysophospholipase L1-like esterase
MFAWKSLRVGVLLLLGLPLLHAGYLLSQEFSNYIDPSPEVWAQELQAIISRDQAASLPEDPLLVTGGLRVRLWHNLPAALQPVQTLLRPLGDATLEDLSHHYGRLIGFYRPKTLLIFPSYSDLHLRSDKTAVEFADALGELLDIDDDYGITEQRYVLVPLKTLFHPEDSIRIEGIARKLDELEAARERLTIVDPNRLLAGDDGRPDPDFYRGDGINLNEAGYARITAMLRSQLEKDGLISIKG